MRIDLPQVPLAITQDANSYKGFEPFFAQFSKEMDPESKKKCVDNILNSITQMIQKDLKRSKETLRKMRENLQ